ncbi:MAG: ACT domain-containing protein [Candidatus Acidiferrales bacterium]
MPVTKDFTVFLEDRAGTLGKLCRALADSGVNILALETFPSGEKGMTRFIVDNTEAAQSALQGKRLTFTVGDVLFLKLANRPGEIARVASRLGESNININYAYCGLESGTNSPVVFFGVSEVGRAAQILEQDAAAAGAT